MQRVNIARQEGHRPQHDQKRAGVQDNLNPISARSVPDAFDCVALEGCVQVLATEQIFDEAILRKAQTRVSELETSVEMPPSAPHDLAQLIEDAVALRAQALPAASQLQSSVDSVLALDIPGALLLPRSSLDNVPHAPWF